MHLAYAATQGMKPSMKLNAIKTKTIIVSRSCTMNPQSPILTIGETLLMESDDRDLS